jgi:hypothetical protein
LTDEYSQRFGTRSSSKPECFGDIEAFEPHDDTCRDCIVRRSCQVIVDRRLERGSVVRQETRVERNTRDNRREERAVVTPLRTEQREDPREEDSFATALIYNGVLAATRSVLRESEYAVGTIPLLKYPVPEFLRRFRGQD